MGETVTIDNFGGRSDEYLRGFEAGVQANVAGKLIAKRDAEIVSLRAELADESPGTPLGRLNAIAVAAKERGLCTGIEAKPAEVFLIEAFDALRSAARQDVEEHEASMVEIANMRKDLDTALERNRQDAEERERLREALDGLIGGATADRGRSHERRD